MKSSQIARWATVTAALFVAACQAPTAPARRSSPPRAPLFGTYDATRPAPVILSAVRVDATTVQVTFLDNAEDEVITHAYFTADGDTGPTSTDVIAGVAGTGERVANVYAPAAAFYLRLQHVWGTLPNTTNDLIWGPFSARADVGVEITATVKRKGKK
jgi:hypothetical protein